MEALSSTLKDLTETESRVRARWEEGTGGSCWVSADGLTQFQGTQWSQRLISKRQIVILSSVATVWWVHLLCGGWTWGRRPGPEERTTLRWGPQWEGIESETVWNAFEMHWNENRADLWLPVESIQKGTQLVLTRLSGWTGGGRVNRPRQWCCCLGDGPRTSIPRTSATSPCTLNPNHSPTSLQKHTHTHTTHTPILHRYYFSIFHSAWVCHQLQAPPSSSSAPITKLSAQIKEADSLTAAKHFNTHMYKHTNCAVQAKQYT